MLTQSRGAWKYDQQLSHLSDFLRTADCALGAVDVKRGQLKVHEVGC